MSLLIVIVISTFTSGEILDKKKSLGEKSNSEVKIQEHREKVQARQEKSRERQAKIREQHVLISNLRVMESLLPSKKAAKFSPKETLLEEKCAGGECRRRPNLNFVNGSQIALPPRYRPLPRDDPSSEDYYMAAMNDPNRNMLFRPAIQLAPPIIVPVPLITPTNTVVFTNYEILTATSTASVTRAVENPILSIGTTIIPATVTFTSTSVNSSAHDCVGLSIVTLMTLLFIV